MQVHTPLLDAAMWARGIPQRIGVTMGRAAPPAPPPPALRVGDDSQLEGWVGLGPIEGREVAFGAAPPRLYSWKEIVCIIRSRTCCPSS